MNNINQQFLLSFLIIILGYVLQRSGILKERDGEAVARVIFNITLPSLIITTFSTVAIDLSLISLITAGMLYGAFIGLIGLWFFRRVPDRSTRGMLSMITPGFNIGMFFYPLVEGIWGPQGLTYFGMFDVGNAFVVFGLSYLIGDYFSGEKVKLNFKNVITRLSASIPFWGYIIACAFNLLGLRFPPLVLDVTAVLAKANMPLSLLLLGFYLRFSFEAAYLKDMLKVISIRYLTGLVVGLTCFFLLPAEPMIRYTLLLSLLLPISASCLPYSIEFNYNKNFVGTLTNITVLISFFLIWLVVSLTLH